MMTTFIVKCADIDQYRQSVSIPVTVGVFRTKRQRLSGLWDPLTMTGEFVRPWDLSDAEDYSMDAYRVDDDGPGSTGIWVWDDSPHDRVSLWRPPFTVDIERAALLVATAISADASYYYNFKLLNSADDTIIAYYYTSSTGISEHTPAEMTVVSTANTVTRSQAVILQIEDELGKNPITGLTVVLDYEPSA